MTNQWMGLWENDLRSKQRIIIQIVVKHYIQSLAEIDSNNLEALCVAFLHLKLWQAASKWLTSLNYRTSMKSKSADIYFTITRRCRISEDVNQDAFARFSKFSENSI